MLSLELGKCSESIHTNKTNETNKTHETNKTNETIKQIRQMRNFSIVRSSNTRPGQQFIMTTITAM